jgi:hypothetical protein
MQEAATHLGASPRARRTSTTRGLRMRPNIRTAIVIGAACGIGAAVARRLSGDGMAVGPQRPAQA